LATGLLGRADAAQLGHMQADRILFLGNSITVCEQAKTTTMWGLSAGTVAKDYAHLLAGKIGAKTGGRLTMLPTVMPLTSPDGSLAQAGSNVVNIADVFERGYANYTAAKMSQQLAWKANIVVLQFGENIPMPTFNAQVFENNLRKLVADLKKSSNPHIFMPSYILGANAGVDAIKRKLCEEDPSHRVFVDLSRVAADASNMGAYAHPNDKGMAVIADALFQAMLNHSTAKSGSR
jgi:lysophospholipase L1-like esterase